LNNRRAKKAKKNAMQAFVAITEFAVLKAPAFNNVTATGLGS